MPWLIGTRNVSLFHSFLWEKNGIENNAIKTRKHSSVDNLGCMLCGYVRDSWVILEIRELFDSSFFDFLKRSCGKEEEEEEQCSVVWLMEADYWFRMYSS